MSLLLAPTAHDSTARRLASAFARAWPALLGYATVRLLALVPLYLWAKSKEKDLVAALTGHDGGWYLSIVEEGYRAAEKTQSNMAFFPLYPWLISAADAILPGVDAQRASLVVSGLAGLAAAWGLFAIGDQLYGRRTGVFLAMVWGALPHGVLQSMAYTEGLFTALSAWTLYALVTRRWELAGVLCLVTGASRPTATALIAVVGLAALIAIVRRRDGWRPWLAAVLAPLGWIGYVLWVGQRTGRLTGWFEVQQAGWKSSWDGGGYTADMLWKVLSEKQNLHPYFVSLVLLIAVGLFLLSVLDRQPWELLLFSAMLLITALGVSGFFHSKARHLMPAFPLLLPVARALARTTWPRAAIVIAMLVVISGLYAGYLHLVWRWSF